MRLPRIARARNDLLFDERGRGRIDLFSGHGAVWLGHANPRITAEVARQLRRVWTTGALETAVRAEAIRRLQTFFPATHRVAGLYSTGMEVAEFAIRIARVVTGRTGLVGFERAMHGKSMATAFLGWDNHDGLALPGFHRLPFVPARPEPEILRALEEALRGAAVSAVFVEPVQGTGGGHMASAAFYRDVAARCQQAGALLVFDEILTGFHRTGPRFFFSDLGVAPDVVLVGKALGNGFPVSAVVVSRRHPIERAMLPGSTYAGNPLASAAAAASLRAMRAIDLPRRVAAIERRITGILGEVPEAGIALRGRGAMWVLEPPPHVDLDAAARRIYARGVFVGYAGRFLRILPPATITPAHLEAACGIVRDELRRAV